MKSNNSILSFDDICKSEKRIRNHVIKTPILTNEFLNEKLGARIYFKAENFQKTGSFKIRGAANKILSYQEKYKKFPEKIVAVSSGNHAQAVANLVKIFGIQDNIIYMEKKASQYKIQATKNHGANVFLTENKKDTEIFAKKKVEEGYFFVHSSNDDEILCGQGTSCLEALEEIEEIDAVFAPCGGGGLIAGTYLACQNLKNKPKIFAVEPLIANDAAITFKTKTLYRFDESPNTIADGTRTLNISDATFPYVMKLDGIYEITENDIIYWTQWITSLLKISIEPTSALAMAGCYQFLKELKKQNKNYNPKILVILSGGNMSAKTASTVWQNDHLINLPQI